MARSWEDIGRRSPSIPLSSARLIALLHGILMHRMSSRIVSSRFFRGLPLLRFPSGLQSMAYTARLSPSNLASCPIQRSLLLLVIFPYLPDPSFPISLFVI